MNGFINIYKPSGITSTSVVRSIKKKFNLKKVGHLGTLDPLACGVLGIAVGKATRMFDYFLEKKKTYRAVFSFGYETDSLDSTGEKLSETENIPTKLEVENAMLSFIGKISQMPPKFSAKHIDGVRAYDLARSGQHFELQPKEIEIHNFKLLSQINRTDFECEIECSSGTYIRSIGRDLAYKLNSLATMTFLERIENGLFKLENAVHLNEILEADKLNLISVEEVFKNFDKFVVNFEEYNHIINGRFVSVDKPFTEPTFLVYEGKVLGVAKENTNTLALKTNLI